MRGTYTCLKCQRSLEPKSASPLGSGVSMRIQRLFSLWMVQYSQALQLDIGSSHFAHRWSTGELHHRRTPTQHKTLGTLAAGLLLLDHQTWITRNGLFALPQSRQRLHVTWYDSKLDRRNDNSQFDAGKLSALQSRDRGQAEISDSIVWRYSNVKNSRHGST